MRFLALFLICLTSLIAAPAHVQTASGYHASGTVAVAYASNVAANNLLIVVVGVAAGSDGSISSVTDSQSNTYTAVGAQINASNLVGLRVYYTTAGSSAANTVTVVCSTAAEVYILEYSGASATVNTSATDSDVNDETGTTSTGNMTSTSADALIFGAAGASGNGFTIDAAYTARASNGGCTSVCMNIGDKNGGTGTFNVSWTWTPGLKHTAVQGVIFGAASATNLRKVIVF